MDIKDFINHFVQQLDDVSISDVKAETRFRDVENWDSMAALTIMAMIDENYKIRITPEEMKRSITIQDLFNLVVSKV